jgi:Arc/MetJ family transcription regulator
VRAQIEVDDELWARALKVVGLDSLPGEVVEVALEALVAEFEADAFAERPVEVLHLPDVL